MTEPPIDQPEDTRVFESAPDPTSPHQHQEYEDSRRRPVRVAHLVVGLVFLGLVARWSLASSGVADWNNSGYVLPAILVAAGALGLVATVVSARRASRRPGGNR